MAEKTVIAAAERAARRDSAKAARAVTAAQQVRRGVERQAARADSAAAREDWRSAYDDRTLEVQKLLTVDSLRDTAVVASIRADSALRVETGAAGGAVVAVRWVVRLARR